MALNKAQALVRLKKLFGKNAMWRYDERAPSADERAAAMEQMPALRAASNKAKEAMEARRLELLRDPEYVRLKAEYQAASKAAEETSAITRYYRVTIGKSIGGFAFGVEAQGDNWQDAFDNYEAKKQRSAA